MRCSVAILAVLISSSLYGSPVQRSLHRDATSKGPLPVLRTGKWGYIDLSGKSVIPPQFEVAECFYESRAAVRVNGKWGFIDPTGKLVILPEFTSTSEFSDGLAAVFIDAPTPQGRVYGYVDQTGQTDMRRSTSEGRPDTLIRRVESSSRRVFWRRRLSQRVWRRCAAKI